jgi:hypothetical protein
MTGARGRLGKDQRPGLIRQRLLRITRAIPFQICRVAKDSVDPFPRTADYTDICGYSRICANTFGINGALSPQFAPRASSISVSHVVLLTFQSVSIRVIRG